MGIIFLSQSPSLRGSGRFWGWANTVVLRRQMSQSPSLRGSGRFASRRTAGAGKGGSLNPLHCGAVVASDRRGARRCAEARVSIPFIAGQWSLRSV